MTSWARVSFSTWTIWSDRRLKRNIQPLAGALERVLELRPVTSEWRDPAKYGGHYGTQIGLIADEVEKVFRCPCHGNRFDLDGAWRAGPAPSHLHRHPVATLEDGGVKVDFSSVFLMIGRNTAPDVQYPTSYLELHM